MTYVSIERLMAKTGSQTCFVLGDGIGKIMGHMPLQVMTHMLYKCYNGLMCVSADLSDKYELELWKNTQHYKR